MKITIALPEEMVSRMDRLGDRSSVIQEGLSLVLRGADGQKGLFAGEGLNTGSGVRRKLEEDCQRIVSFVQMNEPMSPKELEKRLKMNGRRFACAETELLMAGRLAYVRGVVEVYG